MEINYRLDRNKLKKLEVNKNFLNLKKKKMKEQKEKLTRIQYIMLNILMLLYFIMSTYVFMYYNAGKYITFLSYSLLYIVYSELKRMKHEL